MKFNKILALALTSILLVGCGANNTAINEQSTNIVSQHKIEDEPMYGQKIVIGYNGGLCTGTPAIAEAKGFWAEEGLEVEFVNVQSVNEAIGTGKIHITTDHIAAMTVPAVNGVGMKFISGAQTGCKSLYVLGNSGIEKTEDLKGKAIALPDGLGASDHNIALRFLNKDNIDPKEITFKPVERSVAIQAMQNGEVQGVILSDQFAEKFVQDGTLKIIRSLTFDEDFGKEACCVHVANGAFVDENPLITESIIRVLNKTRFWVQDNKEEATKILFDNNWASGDFDQALRMMNSYNFKVSDEETEATLRSVLDDYKKFNVIQTQKSTDELMEQIWVPNAK